MSALQVAHHNEKPNQKTFQCTQPTSPIVFRPSGCNFDAPSAGKPSTPRLCRVNITEMKAGVFKVEGIPDELVHYLAARDAALWIGKGSASSPESIDQLAQLIRLPWRLVLVEDHSDALARAIELQKPAADAELIRQRGFIQVISRDPVGVVLPPRVLPVYLLAGREGALGDDSPLLSSRASARRRLNMTGALLADKCQALMLVDGANGSAIEEIKELWADGLRTKLFFFSQQANSALALQSWLEEPDSPPAVTVSATDAVSLVPDLLNRINTMFGGERLLIRLRVLAGRTRTLDVTDAEQVQTPLLDRYHLLQERDLRLITPGELKADEFNAFFDRSKFSWQPYAAGLPWVRDLDAKARILKVLKKVEAVGSDENTVLYIPSEPGAGGTTFAHQLAFDAAQLGYPTIVAKQAAFRPDLTELSRFMLRVWQSSLHNAHGADPSAKADEIPWLLVFDAQHFRGREAELTTFARRLTHERRPGIILAVVEAERFREVDNQAAAVCDTLTHSISREEAEKIGEHINQFLRPLGKARAPEQWRAFWENHGPRIGSFGSLPAAFWVAMEFWLRDQIDLKQSIQEWLFSQFKKAQISSQLRREVLAITALSVERQPYPEALLPTSPPDEYPYSVQLDAVRRDVPGLALVRLSTEIGRQWAVAHDLLARYLLTAVFRDAEMLKAIGLADVRDPVDLRLALIRTLTKRPELRQRQFLPLANEFAVNILKLDRGRNREFFGHWQQVLRALEEIPEAVWNVSRTLNHHVAVSRRRVATDDQLFHLTTQERREQLELAIEHLTYAIQNLPATDADEPDINLFNSLALAYQNLAALERAAGSHAELVNKLSKLGTEAARWAQDEDPSNSYVLETLARDLIQNAELYPDQAVEGACQSLQYVFRALSLDTAPLRRQKLSELTARAVLLLQQPAAAEQVDQLYRAGRPVGFVAKAWTILGKAQAGTADTATLDKVPTAALQTAISLLKELPPADRDWLALNLQYDLIAAAMPRAFGEQLQILEDMITAGLRLNLQQELEYAILLHLKGRHLQANESFRALRRRLREQDAFVTVPEHLRILAQESTGEPILCDMLVLDTGGYRSRARVHELPEAEVPFIPQDFNSPTPRTRLKCHINFGPKGPLAKPPH